MTMQKREIQLPNVQNKLAFVLDGVLSEEECKALIDEAEEKGFEQALLNIGVGETLATDFRSSQRCIIDSFEKADFIWSRIKQCLPELWKGYSVVGLNERLRILKYHKGDFFKPHMDGVYQRPDGSQRSFITIQLYLNEGFSGGNTTFLSNKSEKENVGVIPRTGSILVFQHDILHEGSLLEDGIKYTIRTDVMYDITTKQENVDKDPVNTQHDINVSEKDVKEKPSKCILS